MIKRLIKFILGVALLPVTVFAAVSFFNEIRLIAGFSKTQLVFLYGMLSYLLFHVFVLKPDFLYVFGHETTHALTARLFGGNIFGFKVSEKGGGVKTDKANMAVALAPYMFPFYSLAACGIYLGLSFFVDVGKYTAHFIFALGVTLSFHLVLTSEVLRIKQSDVAKSGYILSMCLIVLVNIAIISGILSGLFDGFSFKHVSVKTYLDAKEFYIKAYEYIAGKIT